MIGRRGVLAELRDLLRAVPEAGPPKLAMVTGEAGIGKTRLLRELLAEVGDGVTVVAGQARVGDVRRSFALLRDAVEEHLGPEGVLPRGLERWHHPLSHLLEPLVSFEGHPQDEHEHAPEELARAGVALLRSLVRPGPALVVFEDLHWADAGSLEVFGRLARSEAPILLVGTVRPEEFDRLHPLAELLAELERQRSVAHIPVEGFSRQELAEFLQEVGGRPVAWAAVERIHRRTRGNPFFLEELLASQEGWTSRAQGGGIDVEALGAVPLPWSTNEAVLRRLDRLDHEASRLVRTAAVLADPFDAHLLAGVLEVEEASLLPTLAQLIRDGVLVEHSLSNFGFRHALTREAGASQLLEAERRALHAQALRVLADDGNAPAAALVHHALGAGRAADAAAHARDAARNAAHAGTPRETLEFALLALAHGNGDVDLHELASRAAGRLGEFVQASEHAERWRLLARDAEDREAEALAGSQLAWTRWWSGEQGGSRQALLAAVEVADGLGPGPAKAEVLTTHARFLMMTNQAQEAVAAADHAIEAAERAEDRRALVRARLYKCTAIVDSLQHQRSRDLELAAGLIDQALEESARIGDIDALAVALHNRLVPDQPDDLPIERSWQLLDEAKDIANRYGLERLADKSTLLEAHLSLVAGDRERAERALATARRASLAASEANWREAIDAFLGLEDEDLARAEAAHARQLELLDPPYRAEAEMDILVVATAIAAHHHDPVAAEDALRRAGDTLGDVCPCVAANWWVVAISALDAGVAPETVRGLTEQAGPTPLARHGGLVDHMHGVLYATAGQPDRAIEMLQRALAHDRRHRRATLLADAHHRLAELLGARGERQPALEHVGVALELLEGWPGPRRDRAAGLRRRLGDGPASSGELFTSRELEVVRLVAKGFTNSDIAERLFITRKTASTHLSNILAKTGFERRTQVAIWAIQEGIAAEPAD